MSDDDDPFAWMLRAAPHGKAASPLEPSEPEQLALAPALDAAEQATVTLKSAENAAATERRLVVAEALAAARKAVALIRDALDSGAADYDDAIRALPVLHKLVEHSERMEVARKDATQWAPAIVTFDFSDRGPGPALVIEAKQRQVSTEGNKNE